MTPVFGPAGGLIGGGEGDRSVVRLAYRWQVGALMGRTPRSGTGPADGAPGRGVDGPPGSSSRRPVQFQRLGLVTHALCDPGRDLCSPGTGPAAAQPERGRRMGLFGFCAWQHGRRLNRGSPVSGGGGRPPPGNARWPRSPAWVLGAGLGADKMGHAQLPSIRRVVAVKSNVALPPPPPPPPPTPPLYGCTSRSASEDGLCGCPPFHKHHYLVRGRAGREYRELGETGAGPQVAPRSGSQVGGPP